MPWVISACSPVVSTDSRSSIPTSALTLCLFPVSDLVPPHARSSLASLSLLINFSSNLLIGALFLPLRLALSRPAPTPANPDRREGDGTVFYVFVACLVAGGVGLAGGWR